ncbi:hypothetical protein B0T22DRAFT_211190 [Podospora appendiculata]|uniref:DUF4048 domain-containing protein n=1 Tax=Podospora appendiculata TaxID=314037 RepID=A0AAE1CA34_9PEZI|nr:hypothetical protein B0T22DRAFT_211190 [Podospora appendiculata]
MTSAVLLQTCLVSAAANALLFRPNHPLNIHKAVVVARRTTRSAAAAAHAPFVAVAVAVPISRHRPRRNCPVPASPYRRRRTSCAAYYPAFLRKSTPFSIASHKLVVRWVEPAHRAPRETHSDMEDIISLQNSLEEAMLRSPPASHTLRQRDFVEARDDMEPRRFPDQGMPLSFSQEDDLIETRSSRSASTTSRSTNRLSITLPILPPNAFSSRPTPSSTTTFSFPPTPLDTPSLSSPADSNDFITAVAAQERHVLELREQLAHAESELTKLKRQWALHEAHKKRPDRRNHDRTRPLGPAPAVRDEGATRESLEIDRRKALLLSQQSQQSTPEKSRRRVFRGGHTRTLSLLSPTKPSNGFAVHEDGPEASDTPGTPESQGSEVEEHASPDMDRFAPITPAQLAKRASWAPRTTIQTGAVKQIAQDFRAGLWTFMEDLRQATVGEEPITGQGAYLRGTDGNMRHSALRSSSPAGDQDTIRASGANTRPRVPSSFYDTPQKQEKETAPAPPPRNTLTRSKTESSKPSKRFSWTPLTIDSYDDDNAWDNWDTPTVTSPRWSGTTVNSDMIPTIPEKNDENDASLKKKASQSHLSSRSPSPGPHTLEELLPPVLNRLTPGNLKKTASNFMHEWEKSLSSPTIS